MPNIVRALVFAALALFRTRGQLAAEILALLHTFGARRNRLARLHATVMACVAVIPSCAAPRAAQEPQKPPPPAPTQPFCVPERELEVDTKLLGTVFPARTSIYHDENTGECYIFLPSEVTIAGVAYTRGEKPPRSPVAGADTVVRFVQPSGLAVKLHNVRVGPDLPSVPESVKIDFFSSGQVKRGILAETTAIGGVEYLGKTEITYFENGQVMAGTPAVFSEIGGVGYQEKEPISYYENGQIHEGKLGADAVVNGVKYLAGSEIAFFEDGRVQRGRLASRTEIQGNTWGPYVELVYDSDGTLTNRTSTVYGDTIRLHVDSMVAGVPFPAGTEVRQRDEKIDRAQVESLSARGAVRFGDGPVRFLPGACGRWTEAQDGVPLIPVETKVVFYPNGTVMLAQLASDVTLNGLELEKGCVVMFGDTGWLQHGTLKSAAEIGGYQVDAGAPFTVGENGKLQGLGLKVARRIQAVLYKNGVTFWSSGRVQSGTLAADTMIRGIPYKADTPIEYYEDGRVKHGWLARDIVLDGDSIKAGAMLQF